MPFDSGSFSPLLDQALAGRKALVARLLGEGTDAYRLFHGVSEGLPGLTIDRYASLLLVQTFRDAFSAEELESLEGLLRNKLDFPFDLAYNHRGKRASEPFERWHVPTPAALEERRCREQGAEFLIRARHQGIDPWLFLDLRVGRRYLREHSKGKSVLNLFSYTCGAGVAAAAAGAREVWNVDFASSALEIGERNARLNSIDEKNFRTVQEDCLPVIRQLAGLPAGGRPGKTRKPLAVAKRHFDFVFLDPPTWAKGPFGAVDIANDYQSLFKAAILIARPEGGRVIATNHLASVAMEDWKAVLERCATKAGRPIRSLETLRPDEDFPSFDDRPPLKIVVCEI